jgi:primase-polymerase (primpol)-like protein
MALEHEQPPAQETGIPELLPVNFEQIPERLRRFPHFVVWQYELADDEIKKPPFDPKTGRRASVTKPDTWGSFADARAAYDTGQFSGIGIVLTSDIGIVGIDIDHCIIVGEPSEEAKQIITAINSYTEASPSGTGIRMLLAGKLPGAFRRKGTVELYEDMRYLTLTGHHLADTPTDVQARHRELYGLYHQIFHLTASKQVQENTGVGVGHRPTMRYQLVRSDETVLHKALHAKNGENFKRYYHGDTSLWEGNRARHASQSEADFTLVLMLLYWTNNDTTQVDRLFRQSGLMRDKWDRPIKGSETYGERIIKDAMAKGN